MPFAARDESAFAEDVAADDFAGGLVLRQREGVCPA
jgi:hypothetical protein